MPLNGPAVPPYLNRAATSRVKAKTTRELIDKNKKNPDTSVYLLRICTVLIAGGLMLLNVSSCSERQQARTLCYCWRGPPSPSRQTHTCQRICSLRLPLAGISTLTLAAMGKTDPCFVLVRGKKKCEVTQWSPDAALPSYASSLRGVGAGKFISSILPGGCSYAALFTVAES